MMSYRMARRSFLASLGGALGLEIVLGNLEASAAGASSPPRLLVTHWPLGTVPYRFLPEGSGTSYVTSPILEPFEKAGLRSEMVALYGLHHRALAGNGGAHEGGTVFMTTGASSPGTRLTGGETDDSCAGGPSFDQIFLKNVPALRRAGALPINAIGDARVDSHEVSPRCLSYAYQTQSIAAAKLLGGGTGGLLEEHMPLLPELEPLKLYTQLFGSFLPGGPSAPNSEQLRRALGLRKSVLDSALRELARLRTLAPASEREKLDLHEDAIRKVETQISAQLSGDAELAGSCGIPSKPDPELIGLSGSQSYYADPRAEIAEDARHAQLGKLHLAIIRAAFQCDLARVATFQWSSSLNQVAFAGLYPADPEGNYRHNPLSHKVTNPSALLQPSTNPATQSVVDFLANVQTWYNRQMAEVVGEFKKATDSYGNSLLDSTLIPFLTSVANASLQRQPLAALLFGGKSLGIKGGQFIQADRPHNDLWLSVAQALLQDSASFPEALRAEKFAQIPGAFTGAIEGVCLPRTP